MVAFIRCTPDWFYLSPDQSILGMTAYNNRYYYVWLPLSEADETPPDNIVFNGMFPKKTLIEKGTIIIDRSINEGGNRGVENFSCIHECFHQRLHPRCFMNRSANYQHFCQKKAFRAKNGDRSNMSRYRGHRIPSQLLLCSILDATRSSHSRISKDDRLTDIPTRTPSENLRSRSGNFRTG